MKAVYNRTTEKWDVTHSKADLSTLRAAYRVLKPLGEISWQYQAGAAATAEMLGKLLDALDNPAAEQDGVAGFVPANAASAAKETEVTR